MEEEFFGIDLAKSTNASNWKLTYPTLRTYKEQWLKDSYSFKNKNFDCDPKAILYNATRLEEFDFKEDKLLVHKVFNAILKLTDEAPLVMKWRSLFLMKQGFNEKWKITGFCGYIHEK